VKASKALPYLFPLDDLLTLFCALALFQLSHAHPGDKILPNNALQLQIL